MAGRARFVLAALAVVAAGTACKVHQMETPALTGPSNVTASPLTPVAGFSFSPSAPVTNLAVSFDASPSCAVSGCGGGHSITDYTWNFGDGTVTSGRVVSHAYAATGRFTVSLTVTNDAGMADLASQAVSVATATPPTASFISSPSSPQVGQSVSFNANASSAAQGRTIATYSWNFGDGGSATGATATHSYSTAGTYNVGLVVLDDVGQRATATNTVTVTPPVTPPPTARPTAVFVFSPTAPLVGQTVSFNATQSTAAPGHSITNYEWNFGDGGTATGVTATHTFGTGGTFNVVLAVTDDTGQAGATTQAVSVATSPTTLPPTPVFVFSPSAPGVGESVFFNASQSTAASGHTITAYSWNFGDGSIGSGITTNHPYLTAGTYGATLTVTDDTGKSATSAAQTITVGNPPAPTARFTFSPTTPIAGDIVVFDTAGTTTAQGQSIARFDWNFGDGTPIVTCHVPAQGGDPAACTGGANRTIAHQYTVASAYTVNLVVTDTAGRNGSANATLTVGNGNPTASFTFFASGAAGSHTMTFDASGSKAVGGAAIVSYAWTFSDGGSNSGTIVTHVFPGTGTYIVRLTVTDNAVPPRTGTTSQTISVP